MEIRVESGDITQQPAGAIIVNLFEGVTSPGGATGAVDRALDGAISTLIGEGEIKGKKGEMTLIHTLGKMVPRRVIVAGLGKSEDFGADVIRHVMGTAGRFVRRLGVDSAATIAHGAGIGRVDSEVSGRAIAEGALLGLYRFRRYKANDSDGRELESLTVVESDSNKVSALERGVAEGTLLAAATNLCRDMVNEPANQLTPTQIAEVALEVARESDLRLEVLDRQRMVDLGMGALLGVAQGSDQPPKLIVLRYDGDPDNAENNLALVGKGITFDSGGISIKPAANMGTMKGDMAGGAAVICAMGVIGQLKPKLNVAGIVPATENMPGGKAQRPGDIVKTMSGKTIEIDNTDAEGRLVLADGLAYARSLGLTRIVDVATLTGAVVVALGKSYTGAFGNDQHLIDRTIQAGKEAGENIWPMPTPAEYKDQYKSAVADMKNVGGRNAGSITGAMIIGEFADGAAWVHLDIAGTSTTDSVKGANTKGGTGVMVRTLVRLARSLAEG